MARVKFSPIVTDIAGSVGGVTFQRNKFGNTMREKPLPLNPATSAQYNVRKNIVIIQKAWYALTAAQRLQWNRFVDFSGQATINDKSKKLTGYTLYLKYQSLLLLAGRPLLTTITYSLMPALPVLDEIASAAGSFTTEFATTVDSTKYFFILRMSMNRKASVAFSLRGLRYMSAVFGSATVYQLYNSYIAAFGAKPEAGDTIHVALQFFSVTAPVMGSVIKSVQTVV